MSPGGNRNTDTALAELKQKYDELQLRVTRFSVIEQELVHARNRLDREVMIYRRMQQFNSSALEDRNETGFLKLVSESLIDIFEVEVAFAALEHTGEHAIRFMDLEGFGLPAEKQQALQDYLAAEFNNHPSGKAVLLKCCPGDTLYQLIPFTNLIMTRIEDAGQHISLYLLGGVTEKGSVFYDAIGNDREAAFSVFAQQVMAHQTNRAKTEAMVERNLELKKINSELDNFVYSVSHDLRSPLLAIQGLIMLITTIRQFDPEIQTYFTMVNNSVNRMDDTIKEILEYSRNARLSVKKELIDFPLITRQVFDDVKHLSAEPLEMSLEMTGTEPFYSDPYRVTTLMKNLISNAVKYQRHHDIQSFLRIRIQITAAEAVLEFQDNGEGIHPDNQARIFDMFYRASNSSVGTGLGLYICREIVNNLGGSISVVSEPGAGSLFTVILKNLNQ